MATCEDYNYALALSINPHAEYHGTSMYWGEKAEMLRADALARLIEEEYYAIRPGCQEEEEEEDATMEFAATEEENPYDSEYELWAELPVGASDSSFPGPFHDVYSSEEDDEEDAPEGTLGWDWLDEDAARNVWDDMDWDDFPAGTPLGSSL